ncbi:hypothetical protein GEOBRER4_n0063 [Citrifermentans bremense]|uniref:Uncharacterized protein n=1 Tax=Citrifermentans bremense TaxID=60035 RepID=A0A6S6LX25_9BACT|nr:ABC transporter substrate-binding protein [Citrifermentans bremense]BCG45310.1 hypothetical protein GEOBRER4_n0063 [Citrifermentans bremense]
MEKLASIVRRPIIILLLILLVPRLGAGSAGAKESPDRPAKGGQKRVITVVYFPMAVPVAVLGEVLKRDRVLMKTLGRAGVRAEFRTLTKGSDALPYIRKGKVDAALISDMPAIEAASTGEMLIAGTIKRSYASVVARSGLVLEQLRRKKVGNAFGSTSHYALLQALRSARLTESDVNIVLMDTALMPDALARGEIDAFAAWEPIPTAAMKKYPGQFTPIYRQVSASYFLLSRRLVESDPAAADALSAALIRSTRWMKKGDNLALASRWALNGMTAFSGKQSGLSAQDIAEITRTDLLDVPGAPLVSAAEKEPRSALAREFDFLMSIGKLPQKVSRERFEGSISPELLPRLLARHKRHQLDTFDYAF